MDKLTEFLSGVDRGRFSRGGTMVDRLHYEYTPLMLGVLAIILMFLQFAGELSISCWCPAHFTESMVEYTNRRCWSTHTYHVPLSSVNIPPQDKDREFVSYYQWVIAILFALIILLYLPSQLWRIIGNASGFEICLLVKKAERFNSTENEKKKKDIVDDLARRFITEAKPEGCTERRFNIRSTWLPLSYLGMKGVYILNLIFVMLATDWILGGSSYSTSEYMSTSFKQFFQTGRWPESVRFPLVTLCDFPMRVLNQIHVHTIQCTLPLNFYHDKIFVFLWIWFLVLLGLTAISLILWVVWFVKNVILARPCGRCIGCNRQPCAKNTRGLNGLNASRHDRPMTEKEEDIQSEETAVCLGEDGVTHKQKSVPCTGYLLGRYGPNCLFVLQLMRANTGKYVTDEVKNTMAANDTKEH